MNDIGSKDRRAFIKTNVLAMMGMVLGMDIVFGRQMPYGYLPLALSASQDPYSLDGKHEGLVVLNDKPWNVETPAHLLDNRITPAAKLFIRNNGIPPSKIDASTWTLTVDGESVVREKSYTIAQLQQQFPHHTYQLTLECGGNGRAEFNPPAKGNQWTVGGVGCPEWTGVALRDVLNDAGMKSDAVYVGYYGRDVHLTGDPDKVVISRGIPISKAMEKESLIAWAINGEPLPLHNGFPLRLVIGGWPASVSGKWLSRLSVRNKVHDGPKMESPSYRVPCEPAEPGSDIPDNAMCIIESMPVKSLITYPRSGAMIDLGQSLNVRGHAWAGDNEVVEMHVSIDFGATWMQANLEKPVNRLAWQHWDAALKFPQRGYYEVWARATDSDGKMQPMVVPGWNPKGYLNNATHRIAVKVK